MNNFTENQLISFQLDNNPAHAGVGAFVKFAEGRQDCIVVNLINNCKEHLAGANILVFGEEIN